MELAVLQCRGGRFLLFKQLYGRWHVLAALTLAQQDKTAAFCPCA